MTKIQIGDRVETREGIVDADAGIVHEIDGGEAIVGWDSGSITPCSVRDLVLVPAGRQSRHGADHGLPTT